MGIGVNITANGRMSLPADIRKRMGLIGGGMVYIEEGEDGIILRTAAQSVARAQALAKHYSSGHEAASVAEFISDRAAGEEGA